MKDYACTVCNEKLYSAGTDKDCPCCGGKIEEVEIVVIKGEIDLDGNREHYRSVCVESCGKCDECMIPGLLAHIKELETMAGKRRSAIAMLNSMVLCGEKHNKQTEEMVDYALKE